MIAILDYGAGNIFSLKVALERLGASTKVVQDGANLSQYSGVFLPGVGSFDHAMRRPNLEKNLEVPVFGICLGMEIFFESSEEGRMPGLGVMRGSVEMLPTKLKVPHMGWNNLRIVRRTPILDGVQSGDWAYFVHSYMARPADNTVVSAISDYGVSVPALVQRDNFVGTQFHPEKSGETGRKILENFLGMCR